MEQEQQDIKYRILLAARRLFARQGYEGTSVRQICEEAGGNVALVSYHFGGKENVFFALFDTLFPGSQMHLYEDRLKDPLEGVRLLIRKVIEFHYQDPEMATIIQQEVGMKSPRMEGLQKYILPVWQKLRDLLADGREKGIFHFRSLDHTMMFILAALINPQCSPFVEPLLTDGPQGVEDVIRDTEEFILNGLGYRRPS